LSTGGTSDESFHGHHETALSCPTSSDDVGSALRGSNVPNGHSIEVEESDQDEDDFLQHVLQVCNQDFDLNPRLGSHCNNISNTSNNNNNNNSNNTSSDTIVYNNNNVELFDFNLKDGEHMVLSWKAAKYFDRLYVNVPGGRLPAGSRESFVSLLEHAEEILKVETMYLCMNKDRPDRANLLRIFMFLGFEIVHCSSSPHVPRSDKFLFMGYSFD